VIEPFRIAVPQATLDDLHERLTRARLSDDVADDWERGTRPSALRALLETWRDAYDWRAAEARLNELEHGRWSGLHFVRAGTRGRAPLLLLHGWPDSFLRFERVLGLLGEDFDLVVPSIPGYGFSDHPVPGVDPEGIADALAGLMSALGLERFAVQGGDIGSGIAEQLALRHRERVVALHLTDVPSWHLSAGGELSPAEEDYRDRNAAWAQAEGAYAHQHQTKPQTLAYALNDSPVALASWILEKFHAWSDCDDDVIGHFGADALLTNLTLYWVTETAGASVRRYYDTVRAIARRDEAARSARVEVPTALAVFPKEPVRTPREYAERWTDLRRYTELPRGGHFAAWEEPELFADDLRAFLTG
jgi:pimeloyl-ACP methyl ester carboxylesterase